MFYVVTGVPGSGKSSWIDAVTVNLARDKGWATVMASFENPPVIHIAKLCSAYTGVPFGPGHSKRLTPESMQKAADWVRDHYLFMSNDSEMPTVASILDRAKAGIMRLGAKVVVMDPANFLQFPGTDQDHNDCVDDALTQFKNFAMANDVAFILVAHPRKPAGDQTSTWFPQGYSIAGTAGYYNRSDVGITIHRTSEDFTKVIIWKARFGHIAQNGEAILSYDASTGQFTESKVRQAKPQDDEDYF
jgi:twinkle protein